MRTLQIVRSAYRCNAEEQDDPAVWITRAMKGAGADLAVLLRGNAVNYASEGQDASGLAFGGRAQTRPAQLDRELAAIASGGSEVYFVLEDAEERGIDPADFVAGVKPVRREALPGLLAEFDQVWHW
jgi:sulfur relay (sulfurtransferase) DsrF/TusC family protein